MSAAVAPAMRPSQAFVVLAAMTHTLEQVGPRAGAIGRGARMRLMRPARAAGTT